VAGEQESVVQALPSSQVCGLIGVCTHPAVGEQLSVVQALLSSQEIGVCMQPVAGEQESVVQEFWSSQEIGACTHPVAGEQESVVQALPSSQALGGFAVNTHPVVGLHVSVVQALLSLQVSGVPDMHCAVAALHVSRPLHTLPSSHGPQVSVMADVPLAEEVSVLASHVPSVLASCAMLAGVLDRSPLSITLTSKVKVQDVPFAKSYGGASENFTSNGLVVSAVGSDGQLEVARFPMYWMGGGAPAFSP
jgi:hypothetical protein